jgi:hypothetical protein
VIGQVVENVVFASDKVVGVPIVVAEPCVYLTAPVFKYNLKEPMEEN